MSEPLGDDRDLIIRLQAGELEALGDLYDRHRHQIFRTALAITRDTEAAEDILQETFLRVHRYSHRINPDLPISPWLYRVTVNLSYTWSKRNRNQWGSLEAFIERLISPARQAPEPSAEQAEMSARILAAIDALPFNQRVVIVLHYLNGLSLKEIADTLECPVGTVKSRLFHARATLREQLGPSATFLSDIAHGYI